MIFLLLLPGYLLVNLYVSFRLLHWFKNLWKKLSGRVFSITVTVLYFFLALSPILAFVLPRNGFSIAVRRLSTYWMGILLYFLSMLLIADLVRIISLNTRLKNTKLFSRLGTVSIGSIVFICAGVICLYGALNARQIHTTEYEITVNKQVAGMEELNAVLIADTHMGYAIGRDHIAEMVEKINNCEPDIVIFAGDIFDNSYDSLDDPQGIKEQFHRIKSKYGVYATMGNHDIEEKILMGFTFSWGESPSLSRQMQDFVEDCGIKVLYDEHVLVDNKFYLVGRRDRDKPGTDDGSRASISELTKDLDTTKPVFVIAHEPDELQETADAGADIDFSGHTHDGQLFPLTVIVRSIWENPCGILKKGDMTSVVTSGVGVYGPYMRVGTRAEICSVKVRFKGET